MSGWLHPTVRLRLTLLYGALFFVAGLILLALLYGLLRGALAPPPDPKDKHGYGQSFDGGRGGPGDKPPGQDNGGPPPNASPHVGTPVVGGGPTAIASSIAATPPAGKTMDEVVYDVRKEERSNALRQVITQSALAMTLTGLGALVLGWLIAGRVLQPIQEITAHARRANQSNLGDRIDLRGPPDELQHLADTIDEMLDRLQDAFESQRQFSAQASHELRTPLAIIRAEADVALGAPDATERERAFAETIRTAADRSERLVDGLLALARSDSSMRDDAPIDLAELVGDVVGEQVRAADAVGIEVDLELDTAIVVGDRALLERMAGNLIENAIRHNRRGDRIDIRVGRDGDRAVLRVANTGAILDPATVETLFEPFQRGRAGQRSRGPGYGLGLTIVRSVALAHDGSVTADAPPDGGLIVTVRLPLTAD